VADRSRRGRGRPTGRRLSLPPRLETSAGGVVFRRAPDGVRVLLIRDPYRNWGFPKGHVEQGETPREAALREVREETGLHELRAVTELATIDWYFRDQGEPVHKFCHFFLMESLAGTVRPSQEEGISACVWLTPEDAVRTITYDNARHVLHEALRFFRGSPRTGDGAADGGSPDRP
jgi:ADP-ribose pyrophosphatase YjhB (NUDIX family)